MAEQAGEHAPEVFGEIQACRRKEEERLQGFGFIAIFFCKIITGSDYS